jgi:hypothetical protein
MMKIPERSVSVQCRSCGIELTAPTVQTLTPFQLHQSIGEDTSAGRRQTTEDVEDRVPLADIEARVYGNCQHLRNIEVAAHVHHVDSK